MHGFSALQRAEIAEIVIDAALLPVAVGFSALQRAEIAEITLSFPTRFRISMSFSALQRAEIAEIQSATSRPFETNPSFSALQRAEIAEIPAQAMPSSPQLRVSVLFNEPKLLKSVGASGALIERRAFQCSSTSRNC